MPQLRPIPSLHLPFIDAPPSPPPLLDHICTSPPVVAFPPPQVGDFNYRIDSPPGFEPEPETSETPSRNEQLYTFVHDKVGQGGRRASSRLPDAYSSLHGLEDVLQAARPISVACSSQAKQHCPSSAPNTPPSPAPAPLPSTPRHRADLGPS